jgi:2'-5' RNA ligase
LINQLADEEPPTLRFEPHVTLYHPIALDSPLDEVVALLRRLASHVKCQLRLELLPAQGGQHYYQSVLAPVVPNEALLALRAAAEASWGPIEKPYFAHLSLLYGDLDDGRRAGVAKGVNELGALPTGLELDSVVLVRAVGRADEWEVVHREVLG